RQGMGVLDMLAALGAPENIVFAAALLLMLLIGGVAAAGLGADVDLDGGDLLSWLGVGRLPLLVVLVVFLAVFGLLGLTGQWIAAALTGAPVAPWIAVPAVGLAALPVTASIGHSLARVLPGDETSAIELDELIGRAATVVTGRAEYGSPARARIEDRHGQAHFVMVEPDRPGPAFREGEAVLLVRQEGHLFRAISRGDALLPRLD
ncbi:MAG TPA: OB-fold-containig protein, partial [Sphingomonas sp.]